MEQSIPKSREEWFVLVEGQQISKMTQAVFCKEKNLKPHLFSYYKKQYHLKNQPQDKAQPSFNQVIVNSPHNNNLSEIKVELPNGFVVYLPVQIRHENLKNLIGALISC
jgi:hypothetical protein